MQKSAKILTLALTLVADPGELGGTSRERSTIPARRPGGLGFVTDGDHFSGSKAGPVLKDGSNKGSAKIAVFAHTAEPLVYGSNTYR